MKTEIGTVLGAFCALLAFTQPAAAGPGFAYSWLSTDKPFEACLAAAKDLVGERNYPHIATTRFGVTGENDGETLYVNCEDGRHISVLLIRADRPQYQEIDALIAEMQRRLDTGVQ